ncbi:MAG: tRNA-dihydrouridine synthase family protein [Thermodesulfobacteriota bacterium]
MPSAAPESLRFGTLTILPPLFLAPMAGLTHSALRRLVVGLGGVGLLATEMLSAARLPSESPAISPYLVRTPVESPLCYQVLLGKVEEVAPAFAALHRLGADAIDLNLGCPAPNVRRIGGGSSLRERPEFTRQLVAEARRATSLPLSAKIRLGATIDGGELREFCRMLEGEGIELLTVHARLSGEKFCRKPRWERIAQVKEWVKVPIVANGGIASAEDARQCLAMSGADGLMIGRAAAQQPWLFAEIAREVYGLEVAPPNLSRPAVYFRFLANLTENFAPERRLGRLKEFTHYFAKNYPFGLRLAAAVQSSDSMSQASARARAFFAKNDPAYCSESCSKI